MFGWFKRKPKKVWTYIGYDDFWHTDERKVKTVVHHAYFYMTEDGERRVEYKSAGHGVKYFPPESHPYNLNIDRWVAGGAFPEKFHPERDTLGTMLNRLVTERLMGEEGEK